MSNDRLNRLLELFPKIADAVNSFHSPEVQQKAFNVLVQAAIGDLPEDSLISEKVPSPSKATKGSGKEVPTKQPKSSSNGKKGAVSKSNKKGKVLAIPVDSSLDIEPEGKKSLPDFASEKKPSSMQDQSMVIVYWLKDVLGLENVGLSQIHTCYKKMGWKDPKNPGNQLQVISTKKKWLDTSDMENIQLTHTGSQHIEHALPSSSSD